MSGRRASSGNVIPGSEVELLRAVRWHGPGSPGFESASNLVRDTYGNTVDDVALDVAGSSVSGLVDDNEDWNVGEIQLSKNADARASLLVDFMAIQTRCRDLSHAVPNKPVNVFLLALQVLMHCRSLRRFGRGSPHCKQVGQRSCR